MVHVAGMERWLFARSGRKRPCHAKANFRVGEGIKSFQPLASLQCQKFVEIAGADHTFAHQCLADAQSTCVCEPSRTFYDRTRDAQHPCGHVTQSCCDGIALDGLHVTTTEVNGMTGMGFDQFEHARSACTMQRREEITEGCLSKTRGKLHAFRGTDNNPMNLRASFRHVPSGRIVPYDPM